MKSGCLAFLFLMSLPVMAIDNRDEMARSLIQLNNKVVEFDNQLNLEPSIRDQGIDFVYDSLSLAQEVFIDKGSVGQPIFVDWITATRKTAGDNPWTRYRSTMIKGNSHYQLQGQVGKALYVGIQVYSLRNGRNVALPEKNISTDKLALDKQGRFTLDIGPNISGRGIKTDADDYMLIVREYYADGKIREADPAQLSIRQIDGDFNTPFITDSAERINRASAFFTSLVESSLDLTLQMSQNKNNSAEISPKPDLVQALFPTSDNRYDGFYIQLNDDNQAIKITGKIPKQLKYASITYYNPYYATVDYDKNKSYITKDELTLNKDGSYEVYITKNRIMGKKNLITTQGYRDGVISIRYLGEQEPEFDISLVDVDRIPDLDDDEDDLAKQNGGGSSSWGALMVLAITAMRRYRV